MIKRNDFILISVVILLGIAVIVFMNVTKTSGSYVTIYVAGEEFKTLSLNEDITFTVEGEQGEWNTFEIKDGYVDMIDASCPDKVCVNERAIHYNKDRITCLPNRVYLEVVSDIENDVDAVAK